MPRWSKPSSLQTNTATDSVREIAQDAGFVRRCKGGDLTQVFLNLSQIRSHTGADWKYDRGVAGKALPPIIAGPIVLDLAVSSAPAELAHFTLIRPFLDRPNA